MPLCIYWSINHNAFLAYLNTYCHSFLLFFIMDEADISCICIFPLCMLGNFSRFFAVCRFFQNYFFRKILSGISSECQTVWIHIRPDVTSGLIWFQTACKGHQQTTVWSLVGKELQVPKILKKITKVESVINPYKEATFAADKFCCFLRKPNKVDKSHEMSRFYIKKM